MMTRALLAVVCFGSGAVARPTLVAGRVWAAFGCIAAESELARSR
jgi:hypothetical protein